MGVILLVGSCVAASCALVGSFLVLRRMALLGDARAELASDLLRVRPPVRVRRRSRAHLVLVK